MARINQGILGGLSGKIANIVGGSWKGINYIRSLPVSVANPRTVPQVAQRTKMAEVVAFAKIILASLIKPLWDRFAIKQSGYNAFVSENIDFMDLTGTAYLNALVISKGAIGVPIILTYAATTTTMAVTWSTALPDNLSSPTDEVYALVIQQLPNGDLYYHHAGNTNEIRNDGAWNINLNQPVSLLGGTLATYLIFRNTEGTRVSGNSTSLDAM